MALACVYQEVACTLQLIPPGPGLCNVVQRLPKKVAVAVSAASHLPCRRHKAQAGNKVQTVPRGLISYKLKR